MVIRVPDFYDKFRCWAEKCPHNCCLGWDVVVDDWTAARWQKCDHAIGEKLRSSLYRDPEGDTCIRQKDGRCAFLNEQNLCEIQLQLDQNWLSEVCREHPRFTEDYGPFREITLSASCPAANELLLGSTQPLTFREIETEEPGDEGDEWLPDLALLRDKLLELLTDRTRPLKERYGAFLALAEDAQDLLDDDAAEELPDLLDAWDAEEAAVVPDYVRKHWNLLEQIDSLEPAWTKLLKTAKSTRLKPQPEELMERVAVYFAFRWLLKAVNDGDMLSRAHWCLFAVAAVEQLASVCGLPEALRQFSCEVEHSDDAMDAILDELG